MIGFHIDMNMAHYRAEYLRRWLRELAGCGYDTVVWEVENSVAWETCPECASPDALSKREFADLIAECRALGLEPIPLFQTIGHAEYVLKHAPYAHLRELPDRIDQYCPRNAGVVPFLHRWIEEYLDVFGDVRFFHLGADEAWALGACPQCREYAESQSLSRLYIEHVNAVAAPLVERKIAPIIWADMVLHYHQALDELSRHFVLFDWMYDIYRANGKVWVWGQGLRSKEELDAETRKLFEPYLFPQGDEPGREPETFYTADFLADRDFRVVTCPASSSYGDNVFSPRNWLHMVNTFDSFRKGMSAHLSGSVLTSWSVRLHPWELQLAPIAILGFVKANPCASIEEFQSWFVRERFGVEDVGFWRACGLLSKRCLFSDSGTLGYGKDCLPVPGGYVRGTLSRIREQGRLEAEVRNCRERRKEYSEGLQLLETFARRAAHGTEWLAVWNLAARNLIHRAEVSDFLLTHAQQVVQVSALQGAERAEAQSLLRRMGALREETNALYATMIRPARRAEMIGYMFDAVERSVAVLAGYSATDSVC